MIIAGEIKRIEDWYYKAGPKDKDSQWKDDYSAKEFAKLWFDKNDKISLPLSIKKLLGNIFGQFEFLNMSQELILLLVGKEIMICFYSVKKKKGKIL